LIILHILLGSYVPITPLHKIRQNSIKNLVAQGVGNVKLIDYSLQTAKHFQPKIKESHDLPFLASNAFKLNIPLITWAN
jgi:hypothetical protein